MDIESLHLNAFDLIIGAIVLILSIKGTLNGLVKEAFGLLGLVGGVYIASRTAQAAAGFVDTNFYHLENQTALKLIGFMVVFAIVWIVCIALGNLFSKLTHASGFGFINRLGGFIAGGGKYLLIFAVIVSALSNVTLIRDNLEQKLQDSILYPYLKTAGSYLINLDPNIILTDESNAPAASATPSDTNGSNIIKVSE